MKKSHHHVLEASSVPPVSEEQQQLLQEDKQQYEKTTRKRRELSLVEKVQLLHQAQEEEKSQRQLARSFGVAVGTVNTILKRKEEYLKQYDNLQQASSTKKKKMMMIIGSEIYYDTRTHPKLRRFRHDQLNALVWEWYTVARSKQMILNGTQLKAKALEFAKRLASFDDFKASNGWLHGFCKRHNISFVQNQQNTRKFLNEQPLKVWFNFPQIKNMIKEYHPKDVYSCIETRLLYLTLPDEIRNADFIVDEKDCLTLLLCSNAMGEKENPMIITDSRSHRETKMKAQNRPDGWKVSHQAWMTSSIFFDWLEALDLKMASQKRRILLYIPSSPCHPIDCDLPNITVRTFPPNVLPQSYPLSSGIAIDLKKKYRTFFLRHIYSRMCENGMLRSEILSKIDFFSVNYWINCAWKEVGPQGIIRSFGISSHSVATAAKTKYDDLMSVTANNEDLDNIMNLLFPYLSSDSHWLASDEYAGFDNGFATNLSFDSDDWEEQLIHRTNLFFEKTDEDIVLDSNLVELSNTAPSELSDVTPPVASREDTVAENDEEKIITHATARRMIDALKRYAIEKEPSLIEHIVRTSQHFDELTVKRSTRTFNTRGSTEYTTDGVWV